ncbi:transferase hexapeptide repeat containing protein [Candidatus Entotheonella palauensis]|uniref:transferase hexapeptide repeat containing protein n=1 Tax=Candidatus Entotheonella palauensis TaxID=93172 RepID=UPI0011780821|nr:transferase hexapeptide repeat containing protein [Candidatus Entotheonella palauensis]
MPPATTLEERVAALEKTVAQLLSRSDATITKKDWRSALGMFADDPIMREIDEEGRRIREADRQQVQP